MDFTLDAEQTALRDSVRGLLKGYDVTHRREVTATDPGFDETMWGRLAELGALGLPFPEDAGGMGAGPIELCVVAEEVGRALAPEPYAAVVALAGSLVDALGSDEQRANLLGRLSEGALVAAVALHPNGFSVDGDTLTGTLDPVFHGDRADVLVVVTGDADEPTGWVVPTDGLERTSYATIDGGRAARITLSASPAQRLAGSGDAADGLARAVATARIAFCCEALGAMDTALRMTTDYLKTRQQFGVTLNKFQALTFRAADMYTSLELTRSLVWWAAMVLADEDSATAEVVEAATRAKLQVSRAGRHIGQEAIQLHGGIGMTAEYAVGHHVARLVVIDHLLGDGDDAVRELSATVGDHGVVEALP